MDNKKGKPIWEQAREILYSDKKDKGRTLMVLGIFLMVTGVSMETLEPVLKIRTSTIFIALGLIVFITGFVLYILED